MRSVDVSKRFKKCRIQDTVESDMQFKLLPMTEFARRKGTEKSAVFTTPLIINSIDKAA